MAHDVENIVHNLKGDTHVQAVAIGFIDKRGIGSREVSPDSCAGLEQRGGFPFDDLDVVVKGYGAIAVKEALQHLTFSQKGAGIRRPLNHCLVELSCKLKGLYEKKVARYQCRLEAELFIGGLFAPPGLRPVDNVVVKQRRGMNQLNGGRDIDDIPRSFSAEGEESKDRDHRPNSLAAAVDQVGGDIGQRLFAGANGPIEAFLDEIEFLSHTAERVATALKRGDLAFESSCGSRMGLHRFRFGFLNQKGSARSPKKIARKMA